MQKFWCLWMLLLPLVSLGQKNYELELHSEGIHDFIKHPETNFKDSSSAVIYCRKLRSEAISKGYLLASIDSVHYTKNKADVYFFLGDLFESAVLKIPENEKEYVRRNAKVSEKFLTEIPFTPREISDAMRRIHESYIHNGYPFAQVGLDSIRIEGNKINAQININRGPQYIWTEIHVKGDTAVALKYLTSLIGISVGDPFDEKLLRNISNAIEQVPFIKEIKPHEILFTKTGCELYVYVESVAISSFNGVVGLQPDPVSDRLLITGDINLKLLNVLKRGELLNIRWQSIRDQTQSLNSRVNYPFLFGTSFGIDGKFDLYKRDTSFLEIEGTAGVQYFLNRGNYIKAFYKSITSSVLSGGKNNPLFSKLGNTRSNNYGLAFISNRVDFLPNPSRGFNLDISASVGTRQAQANDTLPFLKSGTYRGAVNIEWFIPLHRRHVLRLANASEFYYAEEIFQNEVFRFGGLTEQRGFNEDELFATTRTTSTAEYRFLLDRNSHVFAFYDITWYENAAANYYNDAPYGFGVGFSFRTGVGVFSISYALGKQFDQAIQFNNSKVHFGYIAYF